MNNPFRFTVSGGVSVARIVDNGDAGYAFAGAWSLYSTGHLNDFHQSGEPNRASSASWSFAGLPTGQYRVYATWKPSSTRATNAGFVVTDGSGAALTSVPVNQRLAPDDLSADGGTWEQLGNPVVLTGNALTVRLSNAGTDGRIIADAVRIERIGD
jgi:hypothetical protein